MVKQAVDLEKIKQEYRDAAHAMQTGVATTMTHDPHEAAPKHLRVGVNSALVDSGALAHLLMRKGLITEEEYCLALRDGMVAEAMRYEKELTEKLGVPVHLA